MFHDIPGIVLQRMRELELRDQEDRSDRTPFPQRLRQVPPETGRFLALLLAMAPGGDCIEIGASGGYSALWLALACWATDRRLVTYEVLPAKAERARETFAQAGVGDVVTLVEGDFLARAEGLGQVGFCFLDAEKDDYAACYDIVVPRLVCGGLLVADNALSHRETLGPMIDRAIADVRVDALVVPVGQGELVCRKR